MQCVCVCVRPGSGALLWHVEPLRRRGVQVGSVLMDGVTEDTYYLMPGIVCQVSSFP